MRQGIDHRHAPGRASRTRSPQGCRAAASPSTFQGRDSCPGFFCRSRMYSTPCRRPLRRDLRRSAPATIRSAVCSIARKAAALCRLVSANRSTPACSIASWSFFAPASRRSAREKPSRHPFHRSGGPVSKQVIDGGQQSKTTPYGRPNCYGAGLRGAAPRHVRALPRSSSRSDSRRRRFESLLNSRRISPAQ
jgi:hypothetical protein